MSWRLMLLNGAARSIAWSIIALLYAAHCYFTSLALQTPQPLGWIMIYSAAFFILWLPLSPVAEHIARHLERLPGGTRAVCFHLATAVLIGSVHCVAFAILFWPLFHDGSLPDRLALLRKMFMGGFSLDLLVYCLIAAFVAITEARAKLHRRECDLLLRDAQLATAEANALRHQLQPHFLFNTLNSISALAPRRPAAAQTIIARLGELLRLSLDTHKHDDSTLQAELRFADAYLEIEQARLGDRLRIERSVDDELLDAKVPALLIQPLAENAVVHGISPSINGGRLRIEVRSSQGRLLIRIADDGQGADAAHIRHGIGLGNVRARLSRIYGSAHSLEIITAPGEGFAICILIPLERDPGSTVGQEIDTCASS